MNYVLITLSGGIIDQVTFYEDAHSAVLGLSEYMKTMDPDENDAAVFGPDGLIVNAKMFLDFNDLCSEKAYGESAIFIIANPCHSLGFLVTTPDEPVGYTNPLIALSVLAKMREKWSDVNLYRVSLVRKPIVQKKDLEKYNADHGVKDFEYALVSEYLE